MTNVSEVILVSQHISYSTNDIAEMFPFHFLTPASFYESTHQPNNNKQKTWI